MLLVQTREVRTKRDGGASCVTLADRTGTRRRRLRDCATAAGRLRAGAVVRVRARTRSPRATAPQITVAHCAPREPDECDLADLLDGPPRAGRADGDRPARADRAPSSARTCARCSTPCSARVGDVGAYREAPAAKRYHQAYRHGLLEHCLRSPRACRAIARDVPGIDRDVAVTGALLHDIGKLEAYTTDPLAIDMTDLGKLQGEIPLGYYRVRRLIEDLPGFPPRTAVAVLHIILSHHGAARARLAGRAVHARGDARAHDRQPRRPARLVRPAREGAAATARSWSGFDRALGGGAWFARRGAA